MENFTNAEENTGCPAETTNQNNREFQLLRNYTVRCLQTNAEDLRNNAEDLRRTQHLSQRIANIAEENQANLNKYIAFSKIIHEDDMTRLRMVQTSLEHSLEMSKQLCETNCENKMLSLKVSSLTTENSRLSAKLQDKYRKIEKLKKQVKSLKRQRDCSDSLNIMPRSSKSSKSGSFSLYAEPEELSGDERSWIPPSGYVRRFKFSSSSSRVNSPKASSDIEISTPMSLNGTFVVNYDDHSTNNELEEEENNNNNNNF